MPSRSQIRKAFTMPPAQGSRRDMTAESRAQIGLVGIQQQMFNATLGRTLPRPATLFEDGQFQPMSPTRTYPVDAASVGMQGGPIPRVWQYPVGYNLPTGPRAYEPVSFDTLRQVARQVDAIRAAIQLLKDEVVAVGWSIKPKDPTAFRRQGKDWKKAERLQITRFFETPDPIRGLRLGEWLKLLMEEVLVTDALSIYPRRTLARNGASGGGPIDSDLFALQIIDGSTIKPLIDLQGGRPAAPAPAYQQYLYGVPRSEFAAHAAPGLLPASFDPNVPQNRNLTTAELIYKPYVQAANTVYGMPPVEQVIITAVTWLRRETWWQSYFNDSDIPAMFLMGGEGWTPDQLERWEAALHSLMAGDQTFRWRMKAIPYGAKVEQMKQPNFSVEFDEFLLKMIAMVFRLTTSEYFGMSSKSGLGGRGFLEEQAGVQERKSTWPYRRWLEGFLTQIIESEFKQSELCFEFDDKDLQDAVKQAQIDDIYLKNGTVDVNHVREAHGWGAYEDIPEADQPYVETRAGITPLHRVDDITDSFLESEKQRATTGAAGGAGAPGNRPGLEVTSPAGPMSRTLLADPRAELEQFAKWAQRPQSRDFTFRSVPQELAAALNKTVGEWASGAPRPPVQAPSDKVRINITRDPETNSLTVSEQ